MFEAAISRLALTLTLVLLFAGKQFLILQGAHDRNTSSSQPYYQQLMSFTGENGACFTSNKPVILVTGAAGFIGSHTSMELLEEGHCVVGLDNLSRGSPKALEFLSSFPNFRFEFANLGNNEAVDAIFSRYAIRKVLHLAAFAFVGESIANPEMYQHNNIDNTNNLVDTMIQHRVPTLVFASTCTVYGKPHELPITEQEKSKPRNAYGLSKLESERHILQRISEIQNKTQEEGGGYVRGATMPSEPYTLNARMLRYFNAVGADPKGRLGENPRPELLKFGRLWTSVLSVLRGDAQCLKVNDGGKDERDYVHVMDIARANMLALEHASPLENSGKIWNVATNTAVSTMKYLEVAEQVTGLKIEKCGGAPSVLEKAVTLHASAAPLEEATGWKPQYNDLHEILSTAWHYSKEEVLAARAARAAEK